MAGRLQVFVLVVLVGFAFHRATADDLEDDLTDLVARCKDVGGEQAAVDVINLQHSIMTCINFEGLYAEASEYMKNGDLKGLLEKNCRNKDLFFNCFNQAQQKLSRCFREEEKPSVETSEKLFETLLNFICKNIDDLVDVIGDPKEIQCMTQIPDRCSGHLHQLNITSSKRLAPKEMMCQVLDISVQCVNDLTQEECKDSSFLTLVKSFIKEAQGVTSCPNRLGTSGVNGLVAVIDTLPVVMGSLALGLTAPLVLHLRKP